MVFDPLSLRIISLGLILECAPGLPNLSQKSPPKQARSTTPIVAAKGLRILRAGIGCFPNSELSRPLQNALSDFIRVRGAPGNRLSVRSWPRREHRLIPYFPV